MLTTKMQKNTDRQTHTDIPKAVPAFQMQAKIHKQYKFTAFQNKTHKFQKLTLQQHFIKYLFPKINNISKTTIFIKKLFIWRRYVFVEL